MKNTADKKIKGFSSAYPNMCDLKLLPNIDGTWITIQDDVGTSMTVKLSDLSNFIKTDVLDKIRAEIQEKGFNSPLMNPVFTMTEIIDIIDKYRESEDKE